MKLPNITEYTTIYAINKGVFMENKEYKRRLIDNKIDEYLNTFGALCIEGPKWCGKTWSSLYHCQSKVMLGDPAGNFQNRKLAQIEPNIILDGDYPRLIDEWQEVPELWDAVRYKVDESSKKGKFILTGSATPYHKGIMHSGAGRIAKLRMRPMSLYESGKSSGEVSLLDICNDNINAKFTGEVNLKDIIDYIVRGGWPANQEIPLKQAALLPGQYIQAILDDDIYRIDGIKRDKHKIDLLLRSLARNESTTVSNNKIVNDIKAFDREDIDYDTISNYLNVLERLFLIDNQRPFECKLRSSLRIKQAEKRHLADPSLAVSLLKATPEMLLNDLNTLDFLFESLCERDLKIYAESFNGQLYHYQDYDNHEIDAVIELENGDWCGFEIKLGARQIEEASKNLLKMKAKIERNGGKSPKSLCVICGLSNAAYKREDGVIVVPITALKK